MRDSQHVEYVPSHFSKWFPSIQHLRVGPVGGWSHGDQDIDVFWGTCSPPDEHGYVTLGLGADYSCEVRRRGLGHRGLEYRGFKV